MIQKSIADIALKITFVFVVALAVWLYLLQRDSWTEQLTLAKANQRAAEQALVDAQEAARKERAAFDLGQKMAAESLERRASAAAAQASREAVLRQLRRPDNETECGVHPAFAAVLQRLQPVGPDGLRGPSGGPSAASRPPVVHAPAKAP